MEVVDGLNVNMTGKVVLITGASSGIGIETARAMAHAKAHVIITARDMKKGNDVVTDIKRTTGNNNVEVMELNQSSLKAVRKFVDQYTARKLPLHILICNAGIMATPYQKTEDGYESQFAVNHLSHFLLTLLLLPILKESKPARVIVVSSLANKRGGINFDDINWEKHYDKWLAYAQSKSANILFAKQFNKLYAKEGVVAYSLHPGGIMSGLQKDLTREEMDAMGWLDENGKARDGFKTVEQGASTTIWAALSPELEGKIDGVYCENCAISQGVVLEREKMYGMGPHTMDPDVAKRLWDVSMELTGLNPKK
ncbi:unnamed protein product [Didymodactylos carnosus]|uniref:Uncharacterized protein n=1 Tax=Didymodactylos carnosus TaxID=1234261 RepID=A0A814V315_9BILA|nr:unnamed protein product [Didymodactylos carnosus]CAF1183587.1 unnamed protein product [Didymodactylos carnosus]CAF3752562.1 unnamed protein product [Didymodactylos carnosus]CAF3947919.1 unnamed protein product [Didymodactylos carnosus]